MRTAVIYAPDLGRIIYNSDDAIDRVRRSLSDRAVNWGERGEVVVRLPRRLRFTGFRLEPRRTN